MTLEKRLGRSFVSLRELNLDVEMPDGRVVDARALEYTDLLYVRLALEQDVNAIKAQIGAARARVHAEGQYADAEWYHKANTALAIKKQQLQIVQTMLGLKKREKVRSIERRFVDICREKMDTGLFEAIMRRAQDLHDYEISDPAAGASRAMPLYG